MKSRATAAVLLVALALPATGCFSGPWKLRKSWEDQTADWYGQNAWVHGAVLQDILPVYPLVSVILGIADWLLVNPWYFWTHDAWTNKGTTFTHDEPAGKRVHNIFSGGESYSRSRY